ncbi:MAG: GumC family protein [Longimicrobiales bacterium]
MEVRPSSGVVHALRTRWWLLVATPLATVLLGAAFVFLVTPTFQAATTLRLVEDEGALGGTLAGAAQASGGGLSVLASLTGRGVPLQTEMAVLSSRGRLEALAEELGLRVELQEPGRVPRSRVLAEVVAPLDGPEGTVELVWQGDGAFRVTAELLEARDPFRVVGSERFARRELGTVRPGEPLPLEGAHLVLAEGAGEYDRIVLRLLSRDRAMKVLEGALGVTRPQRDADVVQVMLTWPDPELAAEGANRLVASYLDYREEVRVGQARRTSVFLSTQLDSLHAQLARAEEALRRFREARGVVAPEAQVTAEVERLAELKGRRDLLQAEQSALARLVAELDAGGAEAAGDRRIAFFPTLLQSQATAELLRLLGDLENERSLLLDRRTTDARGIQLMDVRIREIEGELRTAAETYLQGLDNQVGALDAALEGFRGELDRVPAVEMEYVRLRRQVELLTELAVFLETRQKEAELNAAKEGVGAFVLSEARPPQEPVSPKPALTLALALLVGLVLGAAGAVALEQAAGPSATA